VCDAFVQAEQEAARHKRAVGALLQPSACNQVPCWNGLYRGHAWAFSHPWLSLWAPYWRTGATGRAGRQSAKQEQCVRRDLNAGKTASSWFQSTSADIQRVQQRVKANAAAYIVPPGASSCSLRSGAKKARRVVSSLCQYCPRNFAPICTQAVRGQCA
jgi:hypothetical protein